MLSSMDPYSFMSGARIDLDKVLKKSGKHEFHHIYPRAYLERQGVNRREVNILANICFLTRGDNNKIKDRAPSDYLQEVDQNRKSLYMTNALCPEDFADNPYEEFIGIRTDMLIKRAEELMA